MRKTVLSLLAFLFGCGGSNQAVRQAAGDYDPELYELCSPYGVEKTRYCEKTDNGEWRTARPPSNQLLQGRALYNKGYYEPAVKILDIIIRSEGLEDECGRQYARWLRGQALCNLGRHREAFADFASVVRDGPEHPFYGEVGGVLKKLRGKVPDGAIDICLAVYSGRPAEETRSENADPHYRPFTAEDPPLK